MSEEHGLTFAHAALPFLGAEHYAPQTSRLVTGVPRLGFRVVDEGGLVGQGANKTSHLH